MHEVNDLRRKEPQPSDVTFHICADLERPNQGQSIVQTLRLIRQLFPVSDDFSYPTFAYGMVPDALQCDEKSRKTLWQNLVEINNGTAEYQDIQLLRSAFLYLRSQQPSLAEFLFEITRSEVAATDISLPFGPSAQPPVFASFNTEGISYPEDEVRHFLHLQCLKATLQQGDPRHNPTPMEICNQEAQHILSFIPLNNDRLCLQSEMLLNLTADDSTQWPIVTSYWEQEVDMATQTLQNIPHDDRLFKIRQRLEVLYQSRFRDVGVDYFFQGQYQLTDRYNSILLSIVSQELDRTMQGHAYAPSTQKDIVRAIVNVLQQKVIELQLLLQETQKQIQFANSHLRDLQEQWGGINILRRMMGRDAQTLQQYQQELAHWMQLRTLEPGCQFAIKLLNELIPQISALSEVADHRQKVLDEALHHISDLADSTHPDTHFGIFDPSPLQTAAEAIRADIAFQQNAYQRLTLLFYDRGAVLDGEDLLSRLRMDYESEIDRYILDHVSLWSDPPLLQMGIGDRIQRLYSQQGGREIFISTLCQRIPILVPIKADKGIERFQESETHSHFQLLHITYGLSLDALDGFSGQKMFVEPTLF